MYLIGTVIEENRTIKVHGHLDDESGANFLTGMFVEAAIVTESAFAKALPETAIVSLEDSQVVLKLDETTDDGYFFKPLEVKVGSSYGSYTTLISPDHLTETDNILTSGAFNLVAD